MLTWLADLSHVAGVFNLFRYLTFRTLGAATTGLLLVFFFGPMIISALRLKQGKGQPIRADGPASHLLTKKGTPTMGGLMILFGLFASSLLWANLGEPVCLDRAVRHRRLRGDRLLRRLSQGDEAVASRASPAARGSPAEFAHRAASPATR